MLQCAVLCIMHCIARTVGATPSRDAAPQSAASFLSIGPGQEVKRPPALHSTQCGCHPFSRSCATERCFLSVRRSRAGREQAPHIA